MLSKVALENVLAPSWEGQSVLQLILRYSAECAIATLLVLLGYMTGLNLLVAFLLLLLVYSRDVVIFESHAHLIQYGSLKTTTEVAKVFHLPWLINTLVLIMVPFGLPTLVCLLNLGSWSDTVSSIVSISVSHNSGFLSFCDQFSLVDNVDSPDIFRTLTAQEEGAVFLLYITNSLTLIFGILIALGLFLRKSYRAALYKVLWFHNQENDLEKHNYAGLVFMGSLYPLGALGFFLEVFLTPASHGVSDYLLGPLITLFFASFVNQYLVLLAVNLKKWRPL